MRPLEILLSFVNLLVFCTFVIPRFGAIRWMGYFTPAAVLLACIQLLAENPRWQMVPAYVLTLIFFLVWLLRVVLPGGIPVNRLLAGIGTGLGALALPIAVAVPLALPVFHFPRPGGPYRIGTITYYWAERRPEIFNTDPAARRELTMQVWYPAEENSSGARVPYVPDAGALSAGLAQTLHVPGFTFSYLRSVTTNAISSAQVATDKSRYPVLIFLTGMSGFRQSNTFQVQELVSHGYVVAAVDLPYAVASVSFPDGHRITGWTRDQMQPLIDQSLSPVEKPPEIHGQPCRDGIIPYFAYDVSFALDRLADLDQADPKGLLTGRLDLQRVGVFGVSLGAMVAGESAYRDPRIQAVLMMDAALPTDVVESGLEQPAMWITRDADTMRLERERSGGWSEKNIALTLNTMRAVFNKDRPGDSYYIQIPGMFHINFTDAPYWSPLLPMLGLAGPTKAQRGFDIINAYSLAFFDRYLQDCPTDLLDSPVKRYPDVLFEKR